MEVGTVVPACVGNIFDESHFRHEPPHTILVSFAFALKKTPGTVINIKMYTLCYERHKSFI